MKILLNGIIDSAVLRGVNGEDTSKELNLFVAIPWEYDVNQTQTYLWNLHIPLPYNSVTGEQYTLYGKKITIEITIH